MRVNERQTGAPDFISTRKDYRGVDLSASDLKTQHGGAGKRTASISAGYGDFGRDGFNVFGVLDVQKLDAMRSGQRAFIRERPLATTLPAQMSGNPFPANLDVSRDQRDALTLSNDYSSGYTDQNTTYDPATDALLPARRVKAYSLWDLTGSWNWNKNLKLRAGVLNVADTEPPFSNQGAFFLVGFDPTYTDSRGRSFFLSANYAFK